MIQLQTITFSQVWILFLSCLSVVKDKCLGINRVFMLPIVVYFDQLLGAAPTQKLSDFSREITEKGLK